MAWRGEANNVAGIKPENPMLRPYQQAAVDAAIDALSRSTGTIVLSLPTGAGKSHVIAAIAGELHARSNGNRVLCLAPSKELVEQNAAKMRATGADCSLFSASAGEKSLEHPVVFGTPVSVKNSLEQFLEHAWSGVVIDECHLGDTPTIRTIVTALRERWPNLRVIGTTATPYRLGSGYIYAIDHKGRVLPETQTRDPYFKRCVYHLDGGELVEQGYLTPPVVCDTGDCYDTSGLILKKTGKWDEDTVRQTFTGKERLTARIMAEVAAIGADKQGVLVFAATVAHAQECLSHLPSDQSAIVTGKTPGKERAELLRRFLAREIRYLINVQVLTTGFDAPHVDMIALLRKTESVGLLQQIVGRGLRLSPGKTSAKIYDYAGNIETHCPGDDIFAPEIKAGKAQGEGEEGEIVCKTCGETNVVILNQEFIDMDMDAEGFVLSDAGRRLLSKKGYPIPAHYSRRCNAVHHGERCTHKFVWKECEKCQHHNDQTARYCERCNAELIDPNRMLSMRRGVAAAFKPRTERVRSISHRLRTTRNGAPMIQVDAEVETGRFSAYTVVPAASAESRWLWDKYRVVASAFHPDSPKIETVTFSRNKKGFFQILGFNQ